MPKLDKDILFKGRYRDTIFTKGTEVKLMDSTQETQKTSKEITVVVCNTSQVIRIKMKDITLK